MGTTGKVILGIVLSGLIIGGIVGGVWYWQGRDVGPDSTDLIEEVADQKDTNEPEEIAEKVEEDVIETEPSIKQASLEELSFEYPNDWTMERKDDGGINLITPELADELEEIKEKQEGIEVIGTSVSFVYLNSILDEPENPGATTIEDLVDQVNVITKLGTTEVGGIEATEVLWGGLAATYTLLIEHEGHLYEILFPLREERADLSAEDLDLLASIEFETKQFTTPDSEDENLELEEGEIEKTTPLSTQTYNHGYFDGRLTFEFDSSWWWAEANTSEGIQLGLNKSEINLNDRGGPLAPITVSSFDPEAIEGDTLEEKVREWLENYSVSTEATSITTVTTSNGIDLLKVIGTAIQFGEDRDTLDYFLDLDDIVYHFRDESIGNSYIGELGAIVDSIVVSD